MLKSKFMKMFIIGVGCILFLLAAVWYSTKFNDGRFVERMDYSSYIFNLKDIPMIAAILFVTVYILNIALLWIKFMIKEIGSKITYTRTLNPKWGLLGFFGFLGFTGFDSYFTNQVIYPFIFFSFFGFFGFYFEGKLSNTLIDERFRENRNKAQLKAFKVGFGLLFVIILLVGRGLFAEDLALCSAFLLASISIIYAITLFLSEYFLYLYDHDKQSEE